MAKGMKDLVAEARSRVEAVTPDEAHKKAKAGALLLDVREAAELESEGRLGTEHQHVPRGVLEPKADPESGSALGPLTAARGERPVLVFCASGARATLAADRLCEMGYDARVVEGGFTAWQKAGLPVER